VDSPHPHWIETQKDNLKLDFKETGFRQFVSLSSKYLITDAMLMFGLNYSNSKVKLIEALNPLRLTFRVNPGSYLGISNHFLSAPLELEQDKILREFLNSARKTLEEEGFGLSVVLVSYSPYLEDLLLSNLRTGQWLELQILRRYAMKNYRGIFSKMGEQLVEKCIEDLKKEIHEKGEDPELLFKLGVCYVRVKQIDKAREVYKRLKEIDQSKAEELLDMIYEV